MAQGRLMGVLSGGVCYHCDRARDHAQLAQRPARLLGQRRDRRHRRHSFHSIRLDPRIRAVVAGPAWSRALGRSFFLNRPCSHERDAACHVGFWRRRAPNLTVLA